MSLVEQPNDINANLNDINAIFSIFFINAKKIRDYFLFKNFIKRVYKFKIQNSYLIIYNYINVLFKNVHK